LEECNRKAVQVAKHVADAGGLLTAGNICNTWEYDPDDKVGSGKRVRAMFEEQVRWAKEEGVDLVIAETFSHFGEALIALEVIREAGLPAVVTCIPLHEKSCDGYNWEEACRILEDEGADVVGLNCGRGPTTMLPILERVRERLRGPVAALPVPYRTSPAEPNFHTLKLPIGSPGFPVALDPFVLTRFEMADFAERARKMGIDYLGVCCGGAPHHVRAMAEALGRTVAASDYSPDMALHPALGSRDRIREHYESCFFGPPEQTD
jgi:betaine-homocysteine S-methyltransferase